MGGEIIGILWAIPGAIVLAFLFLCVAANAARPYIIPTLTFSVAGSAIAAACRGCTIEKCRRFLRIWDDNRDVAKSGGHEPSPILFFAVVGWCTIASCGARVQVPGLGRGRASLAADPATEACT